MPSPNKPKRVRERRWPKNPRGLPVPGVRAIIANVGKHQARAQLCAEYGVPNTGRQWRRLRKRLGRSVA